MTKNSRTKNRKALTDLHTIHTYEFLYFSAHLAHVDAERTEEEPDEDFHFTVRFLHCVTEMIFCALALESYLNHLGAIRFSEGLWQHLERLSPEGNELGLKIDKSRRPFQSFKEIMQFRNALAHGKTHRASEPIFVDDLDYALYEMPKWMTFCKMENADRCRRDVRAMITELHKKAGIETTPIGSYGASLPRLRKSKKQ